MEDQLSNCCGASMAGEPSNNFTSTTLEGRCSDCKEMAEFGNQASEDEQIDDVLTNAIDYYISGNGVQPEAISRVKSIIRTEKLKLLAELEEYSEVMNSDVVPIYGVPMSVIYTLITKLEAEL